MAVTWTRAQLEELAAEDDPEGSLGGLFVRISPHLLLLLMDYQTDATGQRVELVGVNPVDNREVSVRFYSRDTATVPREDE